jgi:hypothetical protein
VTGAAFLMFAVSATQQRPHCRRAPFQARPRGRREDGPIATAVLARCHKTQAPSRSPYRTLRFAASALQLLHAMRRGIDGGEQKKASAGGNGRSGHPDRRDDVRRRVVAARRRISAEHYRRCPEARHPQARSRFSGRRRTRYRHQSGSDPPVADPRFVGRRGAPWYLRFAAQPRPTVGTPLNTAGATHQAYFGATWTWLLASNVIAPGDGFTFGIFSVPATMTITPAEAPGPQSARAAACCFVKRSNSATASRRDTRFRFISIMPPMPGSRATATIGA